MNLRTTIGSRLLCSLVLCLGILLTAQRVEGGPILPGTGFGEVDAAFHVVVVHGAILAPGSVHVFMPGTQFWDFTLRITESNAVAPLPDFLRFEFFAQHKVGVPGHVGEGPNANFNIAVFQTGLVLAPGVNVFPLPMGMVNHPPIVGHTDQFGGTVTFTVAADGLNITAFTLDLFGTHCSPQCAPIPPIDKTLEEVPEWNALMLFGSGLVGLLGYCRRRKK